MGYIYAHRNKINNKMYIGQSSLQFGDRFGENGSSYLRITNGKYRHPKFANAINKSGWDSFEHIILEDNIPNELLNERESFYINKYNSCENGYNCNLGGDNVGSDTSKKIFMYSIEGDFISEFKSCNEAARYLKVKDNIEYSIKSISSQISKSAKYGKYFHSYRFSYNNNLTEHSVYKGTPTKIYLESEGIKFDSITNAAIYVKSKEKCDIKLSSIISNITRALKNNKPYKKYYFTYND